MLATRLAHATDALLSHQQTRLERAAGVVTTAVRQRIVDEQHRMDMLQHRAAALDPALVLRRGYSITLHEGRAVRSPEELPKGSIVETRVEKGTFKSVVK